MHLRAFASSFAPLREKLLKFEVYGDEFNRLQDPVSFDALIRVRQVTNNHSVFGLTDATRDLTRHLRIVSRDLDVVETRGSQSQQTGCGLNDEHHPLRLAFDLY